MTGEVRDKNALLRFVVDPEGVVVPDPGVELPGRGMWCVPRRDVIERARRKRLFGRAARRAVTTPEDLADRTAVLLRRRCLDRLGLARRGGVAVFGAAKVRAALERGRVRALFQARDGSAAERARLARLGRAVRPDLVIVTLFDAAELDAALGRAGTVHLAVTDDGAAAGLLRMCRKLAGLQPQPGASPAAAAEASPGVEPGACPGSGGAVDEMDFDERMQRAPE